MVWLVYSRARGWGVIPPYLYGPLFFMQHCAIIEQPGFGKMSDDASKALCMIAFHTQGVQLKHSAFMRVTRTNCS